MKIFKSCLVFLQSYVTCNPPLFHLLSFNNLLYVFPIQIPFDLVKFFNQILHNPKEFPENLKSITSRDKQKEWDGKYFWSINCSTEINKNEECWSEFFLHRMFADKKSLLSLSCFFMAKSSTLKRFNVQMRSAQVEFVEGNQTEQKKYSRRMKMNPCSVVFSVKQCPIKAIQWMKYLFDRGLNRVFAQRKVCFLFTKSFSLDYQPKKKNLYWSFPLCSLGDRP